MKTLGKILLGAVVFAIATVPFLRGVQYGLVNCDDYCYVVAKDEVANGLSASGVKFAFSDYADAIWMPLTYLSYMTDMSISRAFGCNDVTPDKHGNGGNLGTAILHAHSALLHGMNAVLVWMLLMSLFGEKNRVVCALAALLWAVHPLRVESVVWIASRKDVLSMFWLLVALNCWMKFRTAAVGKWKWYGAANAFFVIGAMAKPSVMTFPALCGLLDWGILRKVEVREIWGTLRGYFEYGSEEHERGIAAWQTYALPLALALAIAIEGAMMQKAGGAGDITAACPLWWKVINAATSFGVYLWHTVWPMDLAAQCVIKFPNMPRMMLGGVAITGVAGWWIWSRTSKRIMMEKAERMPILTGALWFTVAILPMIGIAGFGYHSYADRFTYIPEVGFAIALAGWAANRAGWKLRMVATTGAIAIVVLGAMTWRQIQFWKDDITLWTHTQEVDGDDSYVAHRSLLSYYFEYDHDCEKVLEQMAKAEKYDASAAVTAYHLKAMALCELGRLDEAGKVLADCARVNMERTDRGEIAAGEYQAARVMWYACDKRTIDEAETMLDDMVAIKPDHVFVYYLRGFIADKRGKTAERDEWWRKLKTEGKGDGYLRFRWAWKD